MRKKIRVRWDDRTSRHCSPRRLHAVSFLGDVHTSQTFPTILYDFSLSVDDEQNIGHTANPTRSGSRILRASASACRIPVSPARTFSTKWTERAHGPYVCQTSLAECGPVDFFLGGHSASCLFGASRNRVFDRARCLLQLQSQHKIERHRACMHRQIFELETPRWYFRSDRQ